LSNAKTELIGSQKDLELAKNALANLIGIKNIDSLSTNFIKPTLVKPLSKFQIDLLKITIN